MVFSLAVPAFAAGNEAVLNQLDKTLEYIYKGMPNPQFGNEWKVMALARSGYPVAEGYFEGYINSVIAKVAAGNGTIPGNHTEYDRTIIALSALGVDARNVGGYDLLEQYTDMSRVTAQGLNGTVFALIAIDTNGYIIPPAAEGVAKPASREALIQAIIDRVKDDGSIAGSFGLDFDAMTVQALAPYYDERADVAEAVEKILTRISGKQNATIGLANNGSSEYPSQVILALSSLGIDPDDDDRFIKGDVTLISELMTYAVTTGGFKNKTTGSVNSMSSEQAAYSLVGYSRMLNKQNSLYNMTDAFDTTEPLDPEVATIALPELVSGAVGSEFNAIISVNSWLAGNAKAVEATVAIPEGVEVVDVTAAEALDGADLDYNLSGGVLRIAYISDALDDVTFTAGEYPAALLTVGLKLTREFTKEETVDVVLNSLKLIETVQDGAILYNVSDAAASAEILEPQAPVAATARVLYTGDGSDLIGDTKMAVAVQFVNLEGTPDVSLFGKPFYYSAELTNKAGVTTYVGLIDADIAGEAVNDAANYAFAGDAAATITFADTNEDELINAQDALNTLSAWLRKTELQSEKDILVMNVTSDERIDTVDVVSIIENYVSSVEFIVANR